MRIFEEFNSSNGETCPICKTSKNESTVLVPIPGTEDDGIVECRQVHEDCYLLMIRMSEED